MRATWWQAVEALVYGCRSVVGGGLPLSALIPMRTRFSDTLGTNFRAEVLGTARSGSKKRAESGR